MNSTTTGEAEAALSPVITTRIPNLSCWNPQFGSMVLIMRMTVCSQCAHWMGVEWPMMVLALQSITAGNMDEAMRLLDQARRAPLSGPAGGPESLIWSDLRWRIEQEASSHSQGIQQKDSPYTISGFPHACVVSLGTIYRSILFLGKERMAPFGLLKLGWIGWKTLFWLNCCERKILFRLKKQAE